MRETRDALAAKGIQLEVLVLPDKTLFYQDKLPDGKALSPEVKRRYQTIQDKLKAAGIATFDDEAVLRRLKDSGQDVFYRTTSTGRRPPPTPPPTRWRNASGRT